MFALPAPLVFGGGKGETARGPRQHSLGEVRGFLCLTHVAACLRGQHCLGDAGLFEGLSGVEGFLYALLAEVNVGPSCEPVLLVPLAFAVTHQNQLSNSPLLLLKHF